MKSTRRDLGLGLLAAAAMPAVPQDPPKEDLNEAARAQIRANSKQLAAFKVDITVEPAVVFKA